MKQFPRILLIAALLGLGVFFWMTSRVTTVEKMDTNAASYRFRGAQQQFDDAQPMLTMDRGGNVIRHTRESKELVPVIPTELVVLAWRGESTGLVEVRIPMWFLRMKGPAINYLLRGTRFDLEEWGMTVEELQAWGPGIVLDHQSANAEWVLIWTE